MMIGLVMTLVFIAVFLVTVALGSLTHGIRRSPLRFVPERLNAASEATATVSLFRDETMSALPGLDRWLRRMAVAKHLERYLEQAAISQRVSVILGMVLLLTILGGRLVFGLMSSWLWGALGGAVFGALPLLYVQRRRRQRLDLYAEQLPDALDVLSRSLRAGQSFLHGIHAIAREMPEPSAREFQLTFEQLRLGRSLREALESHAARVDNLDFNLLATALLIQREVGGNLTEVLENTSQTIRERFKLIGEIRTLSAQNWLAGRIIGVMPIAIGFMIYLLKPDLIMILFKEESGRTMVGIAIVLQIVGFYALRRLMIIKLF